MQKAVMQRRAVGDLAKRPDPPLRAAGRHSSLETRESVVEAAAPSIHGEAKSKKTAGLLPWK